MLYRAFLEDEYGDTDVTSNFSDVTRAAPPTQGDLPGRRRGQEAGHCAGHQRQVQPQELYYPPGGHDPHLPHPGRGDYDLDYTVSATPSSFKDYSSVASYAKTAISDLIGHGIVIGNNSKITPTSNITRAEMAVILHRVLTY